MTTMEHVITACIPQQMPRDRQLSLKRITPLRPKWMAGNSIGAGFRKHRRLGIDAAASTRLFIPGKAIEAGPSK